MESYFQPTMKLSDSSQSEPQSSVGKSFLSKIWLWVAGSAFKKEPVVKWNKHSVKTEAPHYPRTEHVSDTDDNEDSFYDETVIHDEVNTDPNITDTVQTGGTLCANYEHRVRPMIDLIDRLRSMGLEKEVGLPAIVVVGDQSAGKSSVLEAISGVQLPRGVGIVTRCPLELRLMRTNVKETWKCRISYGKGSTVCTQIKSPDEVQKHVRKAQDALAGEGKGLSTDLISLEIQGPDLPDLTLIDLPGIVRIVMRDQPEDMADQIKGLIFSYIEKPETIILAVIPANVDIETSEALAMARHVDPQHTRTLGVITKTDMVDKGAEDHLLSVLLNESYRLKKGYIAVKCRGQQAINNNMTLAEAIREEEQFFHKAKHFRRIKSEQCGIRSLSSRLTDELVEQVQRVLPDLKDRVFAMRNEVKRLLNDLGDGIPSNKTDKFNFLMQMLNRYVDDLKVLAEGEEIDLDCEEEILVHDLCRQFYVEFIKQINNLTEDSEICTNYDRVAELVVKYRGRDLPGFTKFRTFKHIVRYLINMFDAPAKDCLRKITDVVNRKLRHVVQKRFERFPPLKSKVENITIAAVGDTTQKANEAITELFEMERMIFARDDIFKTIRDANYPERSGQTWMDLWTMWNSCIKLQANYSKDDMQNKKPSQRPTEEEGNSGDSSGAEDNIDGLSSENGPPAATEDFDEATKFVLTSINIYMKIAVARISDNVPMVITRHMMSKVVEELSNNVIGLMEPSTGGLAALVEEPNIRVKRHTLEARLDRLDRAANELNSFSSVQ